MCLPQSTRKVCAQATHIKEDGLDKVAYEVMEGRLQPSRANTSAAGELRESSESVSCCGIQARATRGLGHTAPVRGAAAGVFGLHVVSEGEANDASKVSPAAIMGFFWEVVRQSPKGKMP